MNCCDINVGMLKTAISFERSTKVSDGAGGYSDSWAPITNAPTRAFVKSFSGQEQWASERIEARTKYRLVCRYNSSIKESDRVVIRGTAYNINAINNIEFADKWLEIDLSGGVPT